MQETMSQYMIDLKRKDDAYARWKQEIRENGELIAGRHWMDGTCQDDEI